MPIQNYIFDWDGTLAKTLDLWLQGYQTSFRNRGFDYQPTFIVQQFFHNRHEVPLRHPDLDFPTIAEEARDHVFQNAASVKLYDDTLETLDTLKASRKSLTLATSSPRRFLMRTLRVHGMETFLASTVAGDDGYGHKPSPLPFETTLDRIGALPIGTLPNETLIIGDSIVDTQAGKLTGCRTCWFAPEHNELFHDFGEIQAISPDHEIGDIKQLVEIA